MDVVFRITEFLKLVFFRAFTAGTIFFFLIQTFSLLNMFTRNNKIKENNLNEGEHRVKAEFSIKAKLLESKFVDLTHFI